MHQSRRSLFRLTGAAAAWRAAPAWARRGSPDVPRALAAIAASAVADGHSAAIGLGFCLPIKQPVAAGFGKANLETGAPANGDTVFRIASCTRQFTAAAILLLAERGKLKVEDRLSAFFPDFPRGGEVTLHHLLSQTSRLHEDEHGVTGSPDLGYPLLGRIIERASGQSWIDFVTSSLLAPAGMTETTAADPARIVPNRASGYALDGGAAGAFRNAPFCGVLIAEGGLCSTAADLLRWNRALYSGRLLSLDSVRWMTTAATVKGQKPGAPPPFMTQAAYGYGLEVARMFGHRVFWHSGGIQGFNVLLLHFPDDRADLVVLSNTNNGAAPILEPLLRAILHA